ncbi:hypothetical protein MASR1M101_12780 [Gemmatimonas sp.]
MSGVKRAVRALSSPRGILRAGLPRHVLRWFALFAMLLRTPTVYAQTDPRGTYLTLSTPHIRLHYPPRLDSVARLAAVHAERAYGQLSHELAPPRGVVDVLLTDNTDVSNGYAQVFPSNRVVVYAVPPIASRELRFHDDWLRLVITHELAHVFHLDRARGLWRVGRWVFGRNPLFFPNAFTPSWVKEGLAVYYESALTPGGRGLSSEFPALLRAASIDGTLVPYGRWSLAATGWPRGQAAYGYGSTTMGRANALALAANGTADSTGSTTPEPRVYGMRQFVDATASHLVPFRLNRNAQVGFGVRFTDVWRAYLDSLARQTPDALGHGAGAWRTVSRDGWYAEAPRWLGNDSLMWSASTGREVAGLYVAPLQSGGARRVAWRNALDVNVPLDSSLSAVVFAQLERRDPYVLRSDLYVREGTTERPLTTGERLTQPDVRRDGRIVAVQLGANGSRLVQLAVNSPRVQPISSWREGEKWAEPRWSPDGTEIVTVQFLPGGTQRIVVLDTNGTLRRVVTGSVRVFASPSFTATGARLVWASDRSGRMQIETAARGARDIIDTLNWREPSLHVQQVHATPFAVYAPSVSPDGQQVAALMQRGDGFHVVIAPLDTIGPMVESRWYSSPTVVVVGPNDVDAVGRASLVPSRYNPLRQVLPRYWLPLVGEGRRGDATFGASTSGVDILQRHAWSASVLVEPNTREVDGGAAYRYAGLGVPVFDASVSQEWDGTFRVVSDSNELLGTVARRRRFLTASATAVVPRVRWSLSNTLGVQYELRDFAAAADSVLGPGNSPLRTGTRYPSVFVNGSLSTARLALRGVSVEEGFTLSHSTAYRWRQGTAGTGSWRTLLTGRGYVPLPLPGYARHVLAVRAAVGVADSRTQTEFSVGGTSGVQSELLPGVNVGDPARAFPVRGAAPGVQRGSRALGGTMEYRLPLLMFRKAPSVLTVYSDRLSVALFTDAARAWCPAGLRANTVVCLPTGVRDGWLASAGGELVLDLALQYDVPYRVRFGAAAPYAAPAGVTRGGSLYVTLGGYF